MALGWLLAQTSVLRRALPSPSRRFTHPLPPFTADTSTLPNVVKVATAEAVKVLESTPHLTKLSTEGDQLSQRINQVLYQYGAITSLLRQLEAHHIAQARITHRVNQILARHGQGSLNMTMFEMYLALNADALQEEMAAVIPEAQHVALYERADGLEDTFWSWMVCIHS